MKDSDLWETPQQLFDELDKEFKFIIDLCADRNNHKCEYWSNHIEYIDNIIDYIVECDGDGLEELAYIKGYTSLDGVDQYIQIYLEEQISAGRSAFMNPPYSNPKPFIEKAIELSKQIRVVMLIKCDPSTKSWGLFWDYNKHEPKEGVEIRFIPKRLKFEKAGVSAGTASFPSVIVILDRRTL